MSVSLELWIILPKRARALRSRVDCDMVIHEERSCCEMALWARGPKFDFPELMWAGSLARSEVNSILVRTTLWKVFRGQRVEPEKKAHPLPPTLFLGIPLF